MMATTSYSRLWGYRTKPAVQGFTPFKTDEEAKKFRDALYYAMKKQGIKVSRSTLPGQLRKYWEMGVDCGEVCTVYELHYEV